MKKPCVAAANISMARIAWIVTQIAPAQLTSISSRSVLKTKMNGKSTVRSE